MLLAKKKPPGRGLGPYDLRRNVVRLSVPSPEIAADLRGGDCTTGEERQLYHRTYWCDEFLFVAESVAAQTLLRPTQQEGHARALFL